jgi:5-hydroxyisourate hydrolase
VSAVSTHVLDTASGRPAAGVPVRLDRLAAETAAEIGSGVTDADGRVAALGPDVLEPGSYRLVFDTTAYFAGRAAGEAGQVAAGAAAGTLAGLPFYPEVAISFTAAGPAAHYHLPLLLSPFGYSTYRGT